MIKDKEIVFYQPDSSVSLEVRIEDETLWLTQQQIAELFGTKRPAITKHLSNIFASNELEESSVCSILEHTASDGKNYKTKFYNLDAILSVGYRVNSRNATMFRQWANKVLKEYLMRGYAISQRFERLEYRMFKTEEKVELLVKSSLPPTQGIFFGGQIFDAYEWLNNRIAEAKGRIIVIDPYLDYKVLSQLKRRKEGVEVTAYTSPLNKGISLDIKKHNAQYSEIKVRMSYKGHDRFLIIDDTIYHVGGSMKDLGNRLMAYSVLTLLSVEELLKHIEAKD